MRLLLLGKDGQVGQALQQVLPALGDVVALGRRGAPGLCGDLDDLHGLAATVRQLKPHVIVNAAAHTAVDAAEREPDAALRTNAEAPAVLARAAAACHALLVHYSSDYVFDGSGRRSWHEDDEPAPLNAYGRSKQAGEQAIAASGCRHLVLRTSWIHAPRGRNFVTSILHQALQRQPMTVVADQWGAPTSAALVAAVTAAIIPQVQADVSKLGLYHLVASGCVTPLGWARHILTCARGQRPTAGFAPDALQPVTALLPQALARRPRNSCLDTRRIRNVFGLDLPRWEHGVSDTVRQWLA